MAMFPLAFAMIGDEFPREKIAGAQGLVAAMFSVGATIGLIGGASITQAYGWQLTYHTVIPVAFLVLVLTILLLRESRTRLQQPIDVPGAAFLALMLTSFLLGLTEGPSWGWTNWTPYHLGGIPLGVPIFFALAALFLMAFVFWELRSPRPIVDFSKLGERNILLANGTGFFAGTAMFVMFVGLVARTEAPSPVGLGKTALDFGLYSLPTTLTNIIVAPFIGRSIQRLGPKFPLLLGSVLIIVGGSFLFFNNTTIVDMILGPIPIFAGIVAIFIAKTNLVVVSSKPQETGIQTGMSQTFQNLGTAIGPVAASTILASFLTTYTILIPFPSSFQAPSSLAFELVFALIAFLGVVSLLLSAPVRNFRFNASGQRVEISLRRRAPSPSEPAPIGVEARES